MNIKIATPYSNLFEDFDAKKRIIGASDMLELRSLSQAGKVNVPSLFHSDLSIVVPWSNKELTELYSFSDLTKGQLKAVSFHVLSRYRKNRCDQGAFVGVGIPMDRREMEDTAAINVQNVNKIFGSKASILIENNNHLGTDAYDIVTEPEFLASLVHRLGLGLLLDIAHFRITAHNNGIDENSYLEKLPLSKVVQVHLSRHAEEGLRAIDEHAALEHEDFNYFIELLPRLNGLKYVTIEYYKDTDNLVQQINQLKDILCRWQNG